MYTSAKGRNNYFGFGSDNSFEHAAGYLIITQSAFPAPPPPFAGDDARVPCAKVLGAAHQRREAFRPASIVNVSAMSFGSLSAAAIQAVNEGATRAGCLHNTGEGGLSPHHRHGADLLFQIGTGYFGCRDTEGRFDLARLVDAVGSAPVRAIEIKLSQGAKPGLGGVLPGPKVTEEIAAIRGVAARVTRTWPRACRGDPLPDSVDVHCHRRTPMSGQHTSVLLAACDRAHQKRQRLGRRLHGRIPVSLRKPSLSWLRWTISHEVAHLANVRRSRRRLFGPCDDDQNEGDPDHDYLIRRHSCTLR